MDTANSEIYREVFEHFTQSSQEMETRKTRKNGWDDVLRAYHGVLPANWPYIARVTDPVIRTVLIEKTARLIANKLKGQVVPREGGDVIKAKVQNAILSFQWDQANYGGSMIEKWVMMDIQTRLFGSSFGLCFWDKREEGGKVIFEGNEFKVLDNRDVLVDYTATHIRNSNWIQVREFVSMEDLEEKGYDVVALKAVIDEKTSDKRDVRYTSPIKEIRNMTDRVGDDKVYPVIEIVTEYRPDRWITIAPRHGVTLRDTECPYDLKRIHVVQLRYYSTGDDMYGESEVECVLPMARALNSFLSGTIDEMNIAMRPPVKIANNAEVRIDSIVYGPNALWFTGNSTNNVVEHSAGGQAVQNFQVIYPALKSALNNAMGELSQGVNNLNPNEQDKTATEVRASVKQTQVRDQYNQIFLEEALKEQMMFWLSNNKQFLLSDPTQYTKVFRIIGSEMVKELQQAGLNAMDDSPEAIEAIRSMVEESEGNVDPMELQMLQKELAIPKYPVIMNPEEEDPSKFEIKPKLEMDETGEYGNLFVTPEDFEGEYDYIPSIKSMNLGVSDTEMAGRNQALQTLLRPDITAQLAQEGVKVKVKDLIIDVLEDTGIKNAGKLFEDVQQTGSFGAGGAPIGDVQNQGVGTIPEATIAGGQQPMAEPQISGQPRSVSL